MPFYYIRRKFLENQPLLGLPDRVAGGCGAGFEPWGQADPPGGGEERMDIIIGPAIRNGWTRSTA